jgi:hypothetical protein
MGFWQPLSIRRFWVSSHKTRRPALVLGFFVFLLPVCTGIAPFSRKLQPLAAAHLLPILPFPFSPLLAGGFSDLSVLLFSVTDLAELELGVSLFKEHARL